MMEEDFQCVRKVRQVGEVLAKRERRWHVRLDETVL